MTALLLGAAVTQARPSECRDFGQVRVSKNVSQLIRSNSGHFWAWAGAKATQTELQPYLAFKGVVAGDPHMGNFSVVPVTSASGRRSLKFLNIDFDDAGFGPFALDFTRLVIAVKAEDDDMNLKDLVASYVAGLKGQSTDLPGYVQEALELPMAEMDKKIAKYVAKRTDGDRFLFEEGEIERYRGSLTQSEIQRLFPQGRVLDLGSRPKDRGGSADAERIWVLVQTQTHGKRIFELKEYQPTAMTEYQSQPTIGSWIQAVREVFRPGLAPEDYDLVEPRAEKLYWLREKKVDLYDEKDEDLALAIANRLGLLHGAQSQAQTYKQMVLSNPDAFREAVKPIEKAYLKMASQALKKICE